MGLLKSAPVEVVAREGGQIFVHDDADYSIRHGVITTSASAASERRNRTAHFLTKAVDLGYSFEESYSFLREGTRGLPSPPDTVAGQWWLEEPHRSRLKAIDDLKVSLGFKSIFAESDVVIDDNLLKNEVTILLQGKNVFGDNVFSYLRLSLLDLMKLRREMLLGNDFDPKDFGEVVASGRGNISRALRREMTSKYRMIEGLPR